MHISACSVVSDSLQLWTVALQAPVSMGFPRQESWSGLPFLPPEDLPDLGIKPASPVSPAFAGRFLTTERPGKPEGVIFEMFEEVNQLCVTLET